MHGIQVSIRFELWEFNGYFNNFYSFTFFNRKYIILRKCICDNVIGFNLSIAWHLLTCPNGEWWFSKILIFTSNNVVRWVWLLVMTDVRPHKSMENSFLSFEKSQRRNKLTETSIFPIEIHHLRFLLMTFNVLKCEKFNKLHDTIKSTTVDFGRILFQWGCHLHRRQKPSWFCHRFHCSMIQQFQWKIDELLLYYITTSFDSETFIGPFFPNSAKYWNLWISNWCANENKLLLFHINNNKFNREMHSLFSAWWKLKYFLSVAVERLQNRIWEFNCILWNRRKSFNFQCKTEWRMANQNVKPKCIIIS